MQECEYLAVLGQHSENRDLFYIDLQSLAETLFGLQQDLDCIPIALNDKCHLIVDRQDYVVQRRTVGRHL